MDKYLIALDFETTGLDPESSKIIEVGAIKFDESGEVFDTFSSFANPKRKIPSEVTKLTGITKKMLEGSPSPEEVLENLFSWAGGSEYFVAHNAPFEARFIKAIYKKPPDIIFIDTLEISKKRLKNKKSYKLTDLVPEETEERHRALSDAKACISLYQQLASTYKSGKIPLKTYSQSIHEIQMYDLPSQKQLSYIESLGGNSSKVKTKQQASEYIDELKGQKKGDKKSSGISLTRIIFWVAVISFFWYLMK
ncbi:MAG: 3'-5' exonuclease [Gammaproteobacteria bacterium]|nr:3'-5' exonuclease [Gammaproteobacteria bacterium]